MFITNVSEVTMFSHCVFVCLFVCLCIYHGVCPDDLTMKDWCHTNNFTGTLLGMSSCACYVSGTHDFTDDVTRSQSRSNLEIDISPPIFKLECRSEAQSIGNTHGYLSGIFNFRYHFRCHFENFEILIWPQIVPNYTRKKYFSWWWHHRWRHRVASKFPSIFMFSSGRLREQVSRVMYRQ